MRSLRRITATGVFATLVFSCLVTTVAAREPAGSTADRVLTLESIEISGNDRVREATIHDRIGIEPGDPIDIDVLDAARERLLATDYFTDVDLATRPGGSLGKIVLLVDVEERGAVSFETGFGYDTLYGWFVTILGLRSDNTLGAESSLRLGWRFGYRISGVDFSFERPFKPASRWGFGLAGRAYRQEHLFFSTNPVPDNAGSTGWRPFSQNIDRVGAEIGLGYQITHRARITVGVSADVIEPDSTFTDRDNDVDYNLRDVPAEVRPNLSRTNLNGFFLRVVRDTRDDGSYPRRGSLGLVTLQANTSVLGSDISYIKGVLDVRKHLPVAERMALSSRLHVGVTETTTPYYDRFYIGGIYSIRGFREWSLSPSGGDEGFWLYSGEFRFPLTQSGSGQPRVTGVLFFDAGQGWQWDDRVTVDDIESAVGYGIRVRLPWLGTLGIDAGIPLTPGQTGERFRVHGSLGFSF